MSHIGKSVRMTRIPGQDNKTLIVPMEEVHHFMKMFRERVSNAKGL